MKRIDCDFHWNCRDIDIPHSPNLVHHYGKEDGLPNYESQLEGDVRVTICNKCHGHIPGHIANIQPSNLEAYFGIAEPDELLNRLPDGISGTGGSQKVRKKILEYCMEDPYNPAGNHAGKTLEYSLGYQQERNEWKPE